MKKTIIRRNAIILFVALSVFVIVSMVILRQNNARLTEQNIKQTLHLIVTDYQVDENQPTLITKYRDENTWLRITFIAVDGTVTADSHATELENHLLRPEIQDIGTAYTRTSDTLGQEMMYIAMEIDQGYLRIAVPMRSIQPALVEMSLLALFAGMIIFALSYLGSMKINAITFRPFERIIISLNEVAKGQYQEIMAHDGYDEMNTLITEINRLNQHISEKVNDLLQEKNKIQLILNAMNQGLVLFNQTLHVALINPFAAKLFQTTSEKALMKPYAYIIRDSVIQANIEKTKINHKTQSFEVHYDNHVYAIDLLPIRHEQSNESENEGLLMLVQDVTDKRRLETMKKEFFANASHELKSPLTTITGSADLIALDMVESHEEIIEFAQRILHESKQMANLIEDMLYLSQLESNLASHQKVDVNLCDLAQDVIASLSFQAKEKNISITTDLTPTTIHADTQKMTQLFRNLLDNAIKYNHQNGHVSIQIQNNPITFTIKDTGIGIPKADQERIFERFYRVDKGRSKHYGGTGLGLAIVKHIVQVYQGEIELKSSSSEGTTIKIKFPNHV